MHHHTTRIAALGRTSCKALALAVAIAVCSPVCAAAAQPDTASEAVVNFDIPAGDLSVALEKFSTQSGIQAMYRQELVAGKRAPAVKGPLAPSVALDRLLAGTGMVSERVNAATYVLKVASTLQSVKPTPEKKPQAHGQDEVKVLDEMVVVGSRLGLFPYETMSLAKVIDRAEIERSGANNIAQVLSYLPEVSINNSGDSSTGAATAGLSGSQVGMTTVQLRGLPQGNTLVLINGRRSGAFAGATDTAFFDLSTIPLGLVERIEVLPMGASAVYGGDGLAGVINIVLRKDADGFELSGRHMAANGYSENNAGITFGKAWSRGRVMATATWSKASTLSSRERSITANADYRRFGGDDRRVPQANPGNVYSMDGCGALQPWGYDCWVPLDDRGNLPGLDHAYAGVPAGQDGRHLMPGDFAASSGQPNLRTDEYQIKAPSKQYGLGLNASFDIGKHAEIFTEWTLSKRGADAQELFLIMGPGSYGNSMSLVTASNPFNPFGVDVGIDYRFEDTGLFNKFSQTYWRGLVGAKGEGKRWAWEVTTWQSRDRTNSGEFLYLDMDQVDLHLRSSDPDVALNPFVGDGSAPASPDVMRSLFYPNNDDYSTTVQGVNGFVRRSFNLPTGTARALIGAEYERTAVDWEPLGTVYEPVSGDDGRWATFMEARAPIAKGSGGEWDRLAVTGTLRYEATGRSQGRALTKGFDLEFRPVRELSIHANWSTAFKPISVYSASQNPREYITGVFDPKFGGEFFYPVQAIYFGGTPKGLRPETSDNLSFAITWVPTRDLRFSLTHWRNRLRDRLSFLGMEVLIQHEADFPGRVIRDPNTGHITFIDIRSVNIAATDNSGVDLGAEMAWNTGRGRIVSSLNASYVYEYDEKLTPTSDVESHLARWHWAGWAPRWKIVPRLEWQWSDQASATLTARYVSKYEDTQPLTSGSRAGTAQTLGDFWLLDLNMDMDVSKWLGGKFGSTHMARINLGVLNVTNRLPDYCNVCASLAWPGYDPNQYDIMGRRFFAELRMSF